MLTLDRFRSAAIERAVPVQQRSSVEWLAGELRACVEWFAGELRDIGFSASVRDTPGQPIAVGHDRSSRGPSVLFCGHYDVPPAGLLGEHRADEDTFSGSVHTVHQCSADQSTQLMAFVEACRAWKAVAGQLPTPVSVLVEGEGPSGSVRLASLVRMYDDELRADIGLAPAARSRCHAAPTINGMLRGLCCEDFTIAADADPLTAPRSGGAANPARILARILGDLHDPSGRVAIPGFYAGVDAPLLPPCDPRNDTPCDTANPTAEGERESVAADAIPVWPTCEIDSVNCGSSDGGPRTAISPGAFARLSFRLVCDQDPDEVRRAFRDFARARVAPGSRIEFRSGTSARPVRFSISRPDFRKVQDALSTEWGRPAVFACGDAAPVVYALREALGMEVIVTSLLERRDYRRGRRETELSNYRVGIHSWARILDALAQ
jgi:acetylornithine deacetylase/succinyl-diaminopimelate desuccinylase-like protein